VRQDTSRRGIVALDSLRPNPNRYAALDFDRRTTDLVTGDVHVWFATVAGLHRDNVPTILAPSELERARDMKGSPSGAHYVAGRLLLRTTLARYLECDPASVELLCRCAICGASHGRPVLGSSHRRDFRFSLSHTAALVAVAVTRGVEVGVDIERLRALNVAAMLPALAPAERVRLEESTDAALTRFFACWTRKEAYMKGRGLGLHLSTQTFVASTEPLRHGARSAIRADDPQASAWTICDLELSPGYAGALAIRSEQMCIRMYSAGRAEGQ